MINNMQKIKLVFIAQLFSSSLFGENDEWYVDYDSSEQSGYIDKSGNIMIPYGKYFRCWTDTFKTYAIVTIPKSGYYAINKQEQILFEVFPFDNGPDYISDGTFRIINNSKVGFADSTGEIIISPRFDFAFPFDNGLASINNGGHREKSNPNSENYIWKGGKWGIIDKKGNLLLDLKYNLKWNSDNHTLELFDDKEIFKIENGYILKLK